MSLNKPVGRPSVEDTVQLSLPATHRFLNVLHAALSALLEMAGEPVDQQKLSHIRLAVQEVCANIVNHAYGQANSGQRIEVAMALTNDPLTVVVETMDEGSGFDPTKVPVPELGVLQEGGYGLFLIRRAVDSVTYLSPAGRAWQSAAGSPWTPADRGATTSYLLPLLPENVNFWRLSKRL